MGTRCGDMDPAVLLYLIDKCALSTREADAILNKKSGFLGLCGKSDVRAVLEEAEAGNERAKLALEVRLSQPTIQFDCLLKPLCTGTSRGIVENLSLKVSGLERTKRGRPPEFSPVALSVKVYLHRLRRYIGGYLVHLEGDVDAIIFSAGMGENSALLRGRALEGLQVSKSWFYLT